MIHPILTQTYPLDRIGDAAWAMHTNQHTGKLGLLVNAATQGQGIADVDKRSRFADDIDAWKGLS
jgi:crotonyl-CoA reductase